MVLRGFLFHYKKKNWVIFAELKRRAGGRRCKQANKRTTMKPGKNTGSLLRIWCELHSLLESGFDFLRAMFSIDSLKQKQENTLDTLKQHWIMTHKLSASSPCLFAEREVIATTEMSAKSTSQNFFAKVGGESNRKRWIIWQT